MTSQVDRGWSKEDLATPYLACHRYATPDAQIHGAIRRAGWLERQPMVGEEWLRCAAKTGDCYAMYKLGDRLVAGDGLETSIDEGLYWLRRSAEDGYVLAMETLGARLLDTQEPWGSPSEGESLLRAAATRGKLTALFSLGHRLYTGDGLAEDKEDGALLIRRAANGGDRVGMAIAAIDQHKLISSDECERHYWQVRAGATTPAAIPRLGRYVYSRSRLAPTWQEKRRLAAEAARLFAYGVEEGQSLFGAMNLAYLLRRGEVDCRPYPSFDALIERPLAMGNPAAIVNQGLRLAAGFQCDKSWLDADRYFRKLSSSHDIYDWWISRASEGDAEGDLVVGWLIRLSLTMESSTRTLHGCMHRANQHFPDIPQWMFSKTLS